MAMNSANGFRQYVVTDDQGNILGLPPANTVDFEGAGPGNCYVYYMRYTGNLIASMGDNINNDPLSDDCYDLSDDFVMVERILPPSQNEISTDNAETSVILDLASGQTTVTFVNNAEAGLSYQYAAVDQSDQIVGLSVNESFDFAQLDMGVYRVYGVLYDGAFTAVVGDILFSTQLSDRWASISTNAITVEVSRSVGIGEVNAEFNSFQVYPNPATSELNIDAPFAIEQVQILDLQGRIVEDVTVQTGATLGRISVEGLLSGTYVILLSSRNELHTARFAKQ